MVVFPMDKQPPLPVNQGKPHYLISSRAAIDLQPLPVKNIDRADYLICGFKILSHFQSTI